MSVTVDQSWVYKFHDKIHETYQQKTALVQGRMLPMMIHRGINAQVDFFDRLGNVVANDVISPFGQTKILNPEHSRRATRLQSSDAAVLVSDENSLRAMTDPTNEYTDTIVSALVRRGDLHVITAATGSAETASVTAGSGTITFGTQALPSSRKIGSNTVMDLTRIINAYELLSKAGAPNGAGERLFFYSPGQLRDILAITQASSSDFTRNKIHDTGTIDGVMWEGFMWVEIPDVVAPDLSVLNRMLALPASDKRSCIAMYRGAVGLSYGKDITTKINERPDLNNSIQVRSVMMMHAVRLFEGGVVLVDAKEN